MARAPSIRIQPIGASSGGIPRGRRIALLLCFLAMSICAAPPALWVWFVVAATVAAGLVVLSSRREQPTVREVLLLAILFRLILFPLLPSLSDDGYRYIWDGMLQIDGLNPYLFRPDSPALQSFHGLDIYARLNSQEYFSVYPPLSQLIFRLAAWVFPHDWEWGFLFIKLIVTGIEVGGLFLLSTLVEPRKLVLYAWNPLVVVEVAGQGHLEGIAAAALIATVWAVKREKPHAAAAAITGAVWVKLYPVLLVPFVLRRIGWRFVWIPLVLSAAVIAPYAAPGLIDHVASSLDLYVRLFEFNAGPYLLLKWLGYLLIGIKGLEHVLGPAMAAAFVILVIRRFVAKSADVSELSSDMAFVLGGYLVFATTVHPWYLVPILAFAPFMKSGAGAWLWLAVTSVATYLLYSNAIYWPFVWLGWSGVVLIGAWLWLPRWKFLNRIADHSVKERAVEKASHIRPFLPEITSEIEILDLGAGEGYVGERLHETLGFQDTVTGFEIPGCTVTLCDVRDANRTNLPYKVYAGGRLPFADHAFDVTLLVFVLHHTESPSKVIQEARRVSRRRVIIIESVAEGTFKRLLLRFTDRLVNRIRSRGEMKTQEKWLRFRTVDEWITMIERDGGVIQSVRRWGRFHKQALFVIDSEVSGPRREFMVQSVGRGVR